MPNPSSPPMSKEHWRNDAFKAKFAAAAKELAAVPEQLVSLKVRENVGHYHEYKELLDALQREAGLNHAPVAGNFQGNAHLIGNAQTKVIVVEHETGLEILYIAGSVASIISLVPLVLRCWRAIRGHFHQPRHPDFHTMEIRRLDSNGRLVEEEHHGGLSWSEPLDIMNPVLLLSTAENIDKEIKSLKATAESLTGRMNAVEKKLGKKTRKAKTKKNPHS